MQHASNYCSANNDSLVVLKVRAIGKLRPVLEIKNKLFSEGTAMAELLRLCRESRPYVPHSLSAPALGHLTPTHT